MMSIRPPNAGSGAMFCMKNSVSGGAGGGAGGVGACAFTTAAADAACTRHQRCPHMYWSS